MTVCVAAVDCGTSWTKGAVFDVRGELLGLASRRTPSSTFSDGRVEVDLARLSRAVFAVLREAASRAGVRHSDVAGIAVTNQRATLVCYDRDGLPDGAGLSWQDLRGGPALDCFEGRVSRKEFHQLTGLPLDPVFTVGKLAWLRKHQPERFSRAARFGLIQDFVLGRLGAPTPGCDLSNASLTGLLDLRTRSWSPAILEALGLSPARLPALVAPGRQVGVLGRTAASRTGLAEGTPLVSGGGDQQCAGLGAGAVQPGIVAITLGTAAAPLCFTQRPALDPAVRVTCCVHAAPGTWEVEGLQNSAGVCLEWLARQVNGGRALGPAFFAEVAARRPGANGLLFLPYLAGASAPYWIPEATGTFLGLRLCHGKADLARAVLEGVSLQTRAILEVFRSLDLPIREVRLTGGGTAIAAWNQIQADLYGLSVATLANPQATLLGAGILATLGIGAHDSVAQATKAMIRTREQYDPEPGRVSEYDEVYRAYCSVHDGLTAGRVFARLTGRS
ncbi:MAG: hypothetical protein HY814_03500 [Candidatus Riflebacteria bacterium]|nr:hypothetical protein [Candidatus Riflebacteria bacterium]